MTYKKNFVAAIKVNNQILRESHDHVELPFGTEYTILLKNLDTVRMQARISIDGKDATSWLVIEPGQGIDVERFVEDLNVGNRFKFIERTARVEEHRGIGAEDGLVRIEFKRERIFNRVSGPVHITYYNPYYTGKLGGYSYTHGPQFRAMDTTLTSSGAIAGVSLRGMRSSVGALALFMNAQSVSVQNTQNVSAGANDAGITVSGSISNQRFMYVQDFPTEEAEAIVLHLVGRTPEKIIKTAKTVKIKIECGTCGKKNKSLAKFCSECGTSLEKV